MYLTSNISCLQFYILAVGFIKNFYFELLMSAHKGNEKSKLLVYFHLCNLMHFSFTYHTEITIIHYQFIPNSNFTCPIILNFDRNLHECNTIFVCKVCDRNKINYISEKFLNPLKLHPKTGKITNISCFGSRFHWNYSVFCFN